MRTRNRQVATPNVTSTASPCTAAPGRSPAISPSHAARFVESERMPSSQAVRAATPVDSSCSTGSGGRSSVRPRRPATARQGPGVRRGLGLDQPEDELDDGVLEVLRRVEPEIEVLGLAAGELQGLQLQADGWRVVAGRRRGDVDVHADAAEVELARRWRPGIEVDRALQADAPAGVTEEEHRVGRGRVPAGGLEQRDVEAGVGGGP